MTPASDLTCWGRGCESLEPRLLFAAARTVDYFPIDPGISWQYRCVDDGEKFLAETEIRNKRSKLDGVKTSVMDSGEGGKTYYSFADGVLRQHKETWIDDEDGGASTARFDGPYALVPARLRVGNTFENQGDWHGKTGDGMTWTGKVHHTMTVVKREDVIVPAGTFSALRVRLNRDETMDSGSAGWTARLEQINTIWLVKDIGIVKAKLIEHEEYYFQGRLDSQEDMESTQRLRKCDHMPSDSASALLWQKPAHEQNRSLDRDAPEPAGDFDALEELVASAL